MQKSQVVAGFFVPADQYPSEAIHPTLRALHAPPSGFATGFLLACLGLFPPCPDVGGDATLCQKVPYLILGIAFGQTPALGRLYGGSGPLDGDTLHGLARPLAIMTVRAVDGQADGHVRTVGAEAALGAARAAVRGVLAHLFPPRGAWVIAPSMASHSQAMPCKASYATRPCAPKATQTSASTHSGKRRSAERLAQMPVSFSACH
jgi:hypothetical protein